MTLFYAGFRTTILAGNRAAQITFLVPGVHVVREDSAGRPGGDRGGGAAAGHAPPPESGRAAGAPFTPPALTPT